MGIDRRPSPLLGEAIFGTFAGLQSKGNGILAGNPTLAGIFEFGAGRGRNKPLHKIRNNQAVFFRRGCRIVGGENIELIGYISPCVDRSGRSGFFGSCVAIPADQVSPHVAIGDWTGPRAVAHELLEEFDRSFEDVNKGSGFPSHLVSPSEVDDHGVDLRIAGDKEEIFFITASKFAETRTTEMFQAAAFMLGTEVSTLLLFSEPVADSVDMDAQVGPEYLGAMERKVGNLDRRSGKKPESPFTESQREETDASRQQNSIDVRIKMLEDRFNVLELRLDAIDGGGQTTLRNPRHFRSYGSPDEPRSIFDEPKKSAIYRYGPWALGSAVVMFLLAGIAWFSLTWSGKQNESAPSPEVDTALPADSSPKDTVNDTVTE